MDLGLFMAAKRGDINKIKNYLASEDFNHSHVTPGDNTILHVAARFGNDKVLREILNCKSCSYLFHHRNRQGRTPMHIAAAAGNFDAVKMLINFMKGKKDETLQESQENILLVGDNEGNTPLHTAVRNNRIKVVKQLIAENPKLLLSANKAEQSPLSIAIDAKFTKIARWIISNEPSSLDYTGPNQQTLLHCAVLRATYVATKDDNDDFIREILKAKQELIHMLDQNHRNALHYAAVSGRSKIAKELVKQDPSLANQLDSNDQLPLHLAIENNRFFVLKTLLNDVPYLVEVVDKSNRNILHLAGNYGYVNMVLFIVCLPEMEDLINSPDKDGNTPLHLAAKNFHHDVVRILSRRKMLNMRATNNAEQTALEMAQSTEESEMDTLKVEPSDDKESGNKQKSRKHLTVKVLKKAYADRAIDPEDIRENRRFCRTEEYFQNSDETDKEIASTILLVATLIATFTFAAAFAIPGGYEQEGPEKGLATLARRTGFQAFVITDTIAMTSSMTGAVIILWMMLSPNRSEYSSGDLFQRLFLAIFFTWIGLVSMALAFVTGLFVVLSNNMILAGLACAIGTAFCLTCYFVGPALMSKRLLVPSLQKKLFKIKFNF